MLIDRRPGDKPAAGGRPVLVAWCLSRRSAAVRGARGFVTYYVTTDGARGVAHTMRGAAAGCGMTGRLRTMARLEWMRSQRSPAPRSPAFVLLAPMTPQEAQTRIAALRNELAHE